MLRFAFENSNVPKRKLQNSMPHTLALAHTSKAHWTSVQQILLEKSEILMQFIMETFALRVLNYDLFDCELIIFTFASCAPKKNTSNRQINVTHTPNKTIYIVHRIHIYIVHLLWFNFGNRTLILSRWEQANIRELSYRYFDFFHRTIGVIGHMDVDRNRFTYSN